MSVHVCLVYDLLYPYTIGGADRWYRALAERLAAEGHQVTYLTLRHWPEDEVVDVPGVEIVPVGPRPELYTSTGQRRIGPALRFGLGVLRHLNRAGARYDVVHTGAFPYFSLLAATLARRRHGFRIVVDWFEVWSSEYWRDYLGPVRGRIGHAVQRRCIRVPQHAFCFSRLFAERLQEQGLRGDLTVLEGIYAGPPGSPPEPAEPVVVFAGRHIPEKQAAALVPAIARARARVPELRGAILGDGPARPEVLRLIAKHDLDGAVEAPGFVAEERLNGILRRALCLAQPSKREGYGLVVIEAAARGVPSVVVRAPDNAAVELVEEGVNGAVADSAEPDVLADAILRVHAAGFALRESTAAWFERNADRLSLERSLQTVLATYNRDPTPASAQTGAPSDWGWERRTARVLDRARLLRPAALLYETGLGVLGALRGSRRTESGALPVPPAYLRAKVGPVYGDLGEFLGSGERHATLIRDLLSDVEGDPVAAAPILDFGCGCGRVARQWDGLDVDLHGCDINPRLVDWCRRNLPFGRFHVNGLGPPLPYEDDAFGLAYAFSVLTHLPEALQHEWLRELRRILRPGGFLLFTTLGEYYAGLGRLTDQERRRFDDGELVVLFENHAGENFCSAYHPQAYVERTLAAGFDYLAYRRGNETEHHDVHLLRTAPGP